MDSDPKNLVNVEEAMLEVYDPVVTQNDRGELYFNPLAMARLDQTVVTPTKAIGFELLSASEIALHYVEPGTAVAVPFKRPSNKRTGRCSFAAILAMKPFLKVVPAARHEAVAGRPTWSALEGYVVVARSLKSGKDGRPPSGYSLGMVCWLVEESTE